MTVNRILNPPFLALILVHLFAASARCQSSEVKESDLFLSIHSSTLGAAFYAFECGYGISDWRDVMQEDICAPLVWMSDPDSLGCAADNVSLTGNIALAKQGGCPIGTKARIAQEAGAKALLIIENPNIPTSVLPRYSLSANGELPFVKIPAVFINQNYFQIMQPALAGSELMACLRRPGIFMNDVSYPSVEVQQNCFSPAGFRFSTRLTNLSGTDLTNVRINGSMLNESGTEIFSSLLQIPQIAATVTDSNYILGSIFSDVNLIAGVHKVSYWVQCESNGHTFITYRNVKFNGNSNYLATELEGPQVAYRPDAVPASGWVVANLLHHVGGLDPVRTLGVQLSVFTDENTSGSGSVPVELYLFRVNDNVDPDLSNFDTTAFASTSMQMVGAGSANLDVSSGQTLFETEILDLSTALPGVMLDANATYLLAAVYLEQNGTLAYHGFNEDYNAGSTSKTLIFTDRWHRNGLYGKPNAVLRLIIEPSWGCTVSTSSPSKIEFEISPNPVRDYLTLQMAFEESTDAFITFFDINGRVITKDNRKGLIDDKLTYPVSQLPNGAYAVRITTKKGSRTQTFSIQKG